MNVRQKRNQSRVKETLKIINYIKKQKQASEMQRLAFLRFLADSNRCRWCCRPLPNHSAKEPFWFANIGILIFGEKFI